jgi:hypothetical protein
MKYMYFTRKEGLPTELLKQNGITSTLLQHLWEDTLSSQAHTFRLVLIPSSFTKAMYLYFLYWLVDENLKELDRKLKATHSTMKISKLL